MGFNALYHKSQVMPSEPHTNESDKDSAVCTNLAYYETVAPRVAEEENVYEAPNEEYQSVGRRSM